MLHIQSLKYSYIQEETLFENIHLHLQKNQKAALIGNNGSGKSTLLQLVSGSISPSEGNIVKPQNTWMVPQQMETYFQLSIAEFLKIDVKLNALHSILNGKMDEATLEILGDDWLLEERVHQALDFWNIPELHLSQKLGHLSGGQRTRLALAGIQIHEPELVLMDEPSNHLDSIGRNRLYSFISETSYTMLIVSHDQQLLDQLSPMLELRRDGIHVYGGNYSFYAAQRELENQALYSQIHDQEKAVKLAKKKERESIERQDKRNIRGKKQEEKAGTPKVMRNLLKNQAENSTSGLRVTHEHKINSIQSSLDALRQQVPDIDKIRFRLGDSQVHPGKLLIEAKSIQFRYAFNLWKNPISFQIRSGNRVHLKGNNGSGKTTLIQMIINQLEPSSGTLSRAEFHSIYLDQDYSLLHPKFSVYEQCKHMAGSGIEESIIKTRLSQFLFSKEQWDNPCSVLSGGEKMRLILCGLSLSSTAPDLLILDEPTNNLDLQNIEILTRVIRDYQGSLLVVSHDKTFVDAIGLKQSIQLESQSPEA